VTQERTETIVDLLTGCMGRRDLSTRGRNASARLSDRRLEPSEQTFQVPDLFFPARDLRADCVEVVLLDCLDGAKLDGLEVSRFLVVRSDHDVRTLHRFLQRSSVRR